MVETTSNPSYYWILGTFLAAIASFISNLGVALQKLQHRRLEDQPDTGQPYHAYFLWRAGLGLVILGSFADFAALNFAPQSLVAPLGSLTLVSNTLYSPLLLKEQITKCDVISTLVIILGSVLTVVFAPHVDRRYSMVELLDLYSRLDFAIYFFWVMVTVTFLYLWIRQIEALEAKGIDRPEYRRKQKLHQFLYPCISGIIGAQSVLFAKCTVELLANSLTGSGFMFFYWKTYVVIAAMFSCVYFQIRWLNAGLKRFDVSYCVPVFQSFWICVSVVSGMIFYHEYVGMSADQAALFVFSVLVTIAGVVGLSQRNVHNDDLVAMAILRPEQYEVVNADAERFEISLSSESDSDLQGDSPRGSQGGELEDDQEEAQ